MEDYYAMQQQGNSEEQSISASLITRLLWVRAFVYGGKKQNKIGKSLGRIAQNHPPKGSLDERLSIVRSRLVVKTFPHKLKITAIDAISGEIAAPIILQSKSQLKAIYKDNADMIEGNCNNTLFLGGKEKTTLKELTEW